jgi:hypothetical protein
MAALGRVQLYAMTGVVGPVYASKRLFTRLDFQSDKGLESAKSSHLDLIFILKDLCVWLISRHTRDCRNESPSTWNHPRHTASN